MAGITTLQTHYQTIQVPRILKIQSSDIGWSGVAWTCSKQLKHYPAFCRNETSIAVHSFVFIKAEEESHYLGYVEDLYEDKKGQKKVKVRWLHHNHEVNGVIPQLSPHPREVFITPHVQVISAECIDGPATVLTPKHYEKYLHAVPQTLSSGFYMCSRRIKNSKVKPFSLSKLRGYYNQAILSSHIAKHKTKNHKSNFEEQDGFKHNDPMREGAKRCNENPVEKSEPTHKKMKIRLLKSGPTWVKPVGHKPQDDESFKVDEKVELLCQDSGIRGCWFRCMVLQVAQKRLKVQYSDVKDVDEESGSLEEWVSACKVAAPDRLGMRCFGRLTIRPWPTEDSSDLSLEVGLPVDVWWNDGWWEGVVTGVNTTETDSLQVFLPGEDRFLTQERKNVRKSRDWVGSEWLDIKAKPDVLSYISSIADPNMKKPMCSAALDDEVRTICKLEAVEEDKQLPGSGTSDALERVERVSLGKMSNISPEDKPDGDSGSGDDEAESLPEDSPEYK